MGYYDQQTFDAIMERLLSRVSNTLDKREGSLVYDMLAPAAVELAMMYMQLDSILQKGFLTTTYGQFLDYKASEHGLTRQPAQKATGKVRVYGTQGVLIPQGTIFTTTVTPDSNEEPIEFVSLADKIIGPEGYVDVDVEAVEAGEQGNVIAGAINALTQPISGVTSVVNIEATTGGRDIESDESLRQRVLDKIRNQSTSGNQAFYINAVKEYDARLRARVFPLWDGPSSVKVTVVDENGLPASPQLVEALQEFIAPQIKYTVQAETATIVDPSGLTIDSTQTDDTGDSLLFDVGTGKAEITGFQNSLGYAGIYKAKVRIKVDSTNGSDDLFKVTVFNISSGLPAKIDPSGTADSVATFKASDLSTQFIEKEVQFYWNGSVNIKLILERLSSDPTTKVWVDSVTFVSLFSNPNGSGKAPIGVKVTIAPATPVTINITANVAIDPSYNKDVVKGQIISAIQDYIKNIAYTDQDDVIYSHIGGIILSTPGVTDYNSLLINGTEGNIAITGDQVAVLGTVTLNDIV